MNQNTQDNRHHLAIGHNFALIALALVLDAESVFGQTYIYPTGQNADPAKLGLYVYDRYSLPVPNASVLVNVSPYGPYHPLASAPFGSHDLARCATDTNGWAYVSTPADCIATAFVSRSGYAPTLATPMFPGWNYRVSLDLGVPIRAHCIDGGGKPVTNAEVDLFWFTGSRPLGDEISNHGRNQPLLRSWSDGTGQVVFEHVPRGQLEMWGGSPGAGVAYASCSVASAFGMEPQMGLCDIRLLFQEPISIAIPCINEDGDPLDVSVHSRLQLPCIAALKAWYDQKSILRAPPLPGKGLLDGFFGGSLTCAAPGYEPHQMQLRLPLPERITMRRLPTRSVTFTLDKDLEQQKQSLDVYVPGVISDQYYCAEWVKLTASEGRYRADALPDGIDVFGVVVEHYHLLRYLVYDNTLQTVRMVLPASLDVAYDVDGHPPYGALVRVLRTTDTRRASAAVFDDTIIVPTDPRGVLSIKNLIPGTYNLEPHFHYSVFQDSLLTINANAGEHAHRDIHIRYGETLRGHVIDADDGTSIPYGTIDVRAEDMQEHNPTVPVDGHGEFVITGVASGHKYVISYSPTPWDAPWLYVPGPDEDPVIVQLDVPSPMPNVVIIKAHRRRRQ